MQCQDDKSAVSFRVSNKEIDFTLLDNTNNVMKLLRDRATIVEFGKAEKIMHAGVAHLDRNEPHLPTSIRPGASIG